MTFQFPVSLHPANDGGWGSILGTIKVTPVIQFQATEFEIGPLQEKLLPCSMLHLVIHH